MGNRTDKGKGHKTLLQELQAQNQPSLGLHLQNVVGHHGQGGKKPCQADHLKEGHGRHPLLTQKQGKEVVRHGRHAEHHGEDHIGHHHQHLAEALREFRLFVRNLGHGREGHLLHGLHGRLHGQVFEFDGLVVVAERGIEVDFTQHKLRHFIIYGRNQVGRHQTQAVGSHPLQGVHRTSSCGFPATPPPQQQRAHPDQQHLLPHQRPHTHAGIGQQDGGRPAHELRHKDQFREAGKLESARKHRMLNHAESVERDHQEEDGSRRAQDRHGVVICDPGGCNNQQKVDQERGEDIEAENRL